MRFTYEDDVPMRTQIVWGIIDCVMIVLITFTSYANMIGILSISREGIHR